MCFPHQVDEFGDGDLSDGFLHAAESLQRRAKAAGQVVSRDRDKVVLATVQVEHQNLLYGVFAGVQQRDSILTDIHLEIDLQGFICSGGDCDEETASAFGQFHCAQKQTTPVTTGRWAKAYLALGIRHWVLHGATVYNTASRSIWGWKQSDRGPAHRSLSGNDPFEGAGISRSQR